jgi:anthranilate 1,2-dioxygenase small subunit
MGGSPSIRQAARPEAVDLTTLPRAELMREVADLVALHAELIDDDRLEEWPELFTEDCLYSVIPRENADRGLPVATIFCDSRGMLVDRVVSLRRANIFPVHNYRHIISTSRIHELTPDVVTAQTNYVVLQTRNIGQSFVYNTGKYIDQIVYDGGRFLFRSKKAVFDTDLVDTLMVRPI